VTELVQVNSDDVRIACHVSGSSEDPPMVLLHALGETSSSWDQVRAEFEHRFRVIAIDLRGHGESDWPQDYSFALMRDDVLGVLDQLGLREVTLIGHSLGGAVALLVAEERPDGISTLIVEDATPPFPRHRPLPPRPEGPLAFDWAVVPAIADQFAEPDPAWWDRLSEICAPTLLIAGGPDSHIPQHLLLEAAAQIPECSLVTIPAGHLIHESRPVEFISTVNAFLAQPKSSMR
jgi:pimeloyl-ACP methyl ester carboxylesterase